MYTGPDFNPDAFTHVVTSNHDLEVVKKWHLHQGTIKENMCIKINTQFIQMLMSKKILNSDIGRETNVRME